MPPSTLRENYQELFSQASPNRTDWVQPVCIAILGLTGVFFIYSAQAYSGHSQWMRQIVWLFLGTGIYFTLARIDYNLFLEKSAPDLLRLPRSPPHVGALLAPV